MVGLRRNRYLSCFYCGRKTSTRYDGRTKRFDCPSCDATNWLDENGEITDPPASVTKADRTPAAVRYTVPRQVSPSSTLSDSVFCKTCLNNQRLFTASLSQYLPDDPDAPDYGLREKQYYEFRRGLEQRYPQICAECEPKVRKRIEQSAYTAKTDVLRRMIDRSQNNKVITRRSWLDVVDVVGRWLWKASYVLELSSHVAGLSTLGFQHCNEDKWNLLPCQILDVCWPLLQRIPEAKWLLQWSFTISLLSCWWNPRFVQTIRGFTKHLVGIPNWYFYQLMVVLIRFLAPRFFEMIEARSADSLLLAGGLVGAILMALLMLRISSKAIRTDTTPLFRSVSSPQRIAVQEPRTSKDEGKQTMADLLDEIMQSPNSTQPKQLQQQASPSSIGGWGGSLSTSSHTFQARQSTGRELRPLSISPQQSPISPHLFATQPSPASTQRDDDAMDWSPTQSRHRAFSSFRTSPGFSQAPTEETKGPFWYHVPAAPTSLAQRVLNPPNQPRLTRKMPTTAGSEILFRGANGVRSSAPEPKEKPQEVLFADPHFFPPAPKDDPRDPLTDMFASSFTLSQEEEVEKNKEEHSWIGRLRGKKKAR